MTIEDFAEACNKDVKITESYGHKAVQVGDREPRIIAGYNFAYQAKIITDEIEAAGYFR